MIIKNLTIIETNNIWVSRKVSAFFAGKFCKCWCCILSRMAFVFNVRRAMNTRHRTQNAVGTIRRNCWLDSFWRPEHQSGRSESSAVKNFTTRMEFQERRTPVTTARYPLLSVLISSDPGFWWALATITYLQHCISTYFIVRLFLSYDYNILLSPTSMTTMTF